MCKHLHIILEIIAILAIENGWHDTGKGRLKILTQFHILFVAISLTPIARLCRLPKQELPHIHVEMLGNVEEFFLRFAMKAAEPSGSTDGCTLFVIHRDTVPILRPICSESHVPVFSFSASTILTFGRACSRSAKLM